MAISRYLSNPKKKTPDGKQVYKSKRLRGTIQLEFESLTMGQSITI